MSTFIIFSASRAPVDGVTCNCVFVKKKHGTLRTSRAHPTARSTRILVALKAPPPPFVHKDYRGLRKSDKICFKCPIEVLYFFFRVLVDISTLMFAFGRLHSGPYRPTGREACSTFSAAVATPTPRLHDSLANANKAGLWKLQKNNFQGNFFIYSKILNCQMC